MRGNVITIHSASLHMVIECSRCLESFTFESDFNKDTYWEHLDIKCPNCGTPLPPGLSINHLLWHYIRKGEGEHENQITDNT